MKAKAQKNLAAYFSLRENKKLMTENEISKLVVDLCFKIHKQYGPGLFESVYEEIFSYEWSKNAIPFTRQQGIPLVHEEIRILKREGRRVIC